MTRELEAIIASLTATKELEGHSKNTKISIKNLVAYLVGWRQLVLKWNESKMQGQNVDFPETGYKCRICSFLVFSFLIPFMGYSQTISDTLYKKEVEVNSAVISGTVTSSNRGVANLTIFLLKMPDSSLQATELTNDSGNYIFIQIPPDTYLIETKSNDYETTRLPIEVKPGKGYYQPIEIERKNTAQLKEVSIIATRPFLEMSLGKIVLNIEGSATTAGSNVLELLRRLPGVSVDKNGSISMTGKGGVFVLIDERPTYLPAEELANYLRSISADEITQIELITQPGAKYDASGNTGIINIIQKKNKKQGWSGSMTLSCRQGVYSQRNESLLLNFKWKKLSTSLGLTDMKATTFERLKGNAYFMDSSTGKITDLSVIHSEPRETFSNSSLRFIAEYGWTDRTKMGISFRGTYHPNRTDGYIFSENFDYLHNDRFYNKIVTADGFIRKDLISNVYLTNKIGKEGLLDMNFDYLSFANNAFQDVVNSSYDSQMHELTSPINLKSDQVTDIDVYSAKVDYSGSIKGNVKLQTGFKSSLVTTDNIADFMVLQNNTWITDTTKSNHFRYREHITAVYVNATGKFRSKWEGSIGLRVEQTAAEGIQYTHYTKFNRNYLSLFPTVFITYKGDKNNQVEFNYGRRIERPAYRLLNPFYYYSFEKNYSVGNPNLRPQYANNIELKHVFKNMIISTLSFSSIKDVFNELFEADVNTKDVYKLNKNLASNNFVVLSFIFNKELNKWWALNVSGGIFSASYSGFVNNKQTKVEWSGYSMTLNTQFDLGKGYKAETYAFYNSAGRTSIMGSFDANFYFELGTSKMIKDRLLIKVSAMDPLKLYGFRTINRSDNYVFDAKYRSTSQSISISASYKFGGKQAGEQKSRSLDEAKRIK